MLSFGKKKKKSKVVILGLTIVGSIITAIALAKKKCKKLIGLAGHSGADFRKKLHLTLIFPDEKNLFCYLFNLQGVHSETL